MKHRLHTLSLLDLVIAATAKYLQEFFCFTASPLHVLTIDAKLAKLIRLCPELSAPIGPYRATSSCCSGCYSLPTVAFRP